MPRKVLGKLCREARRDISANYGAGQRYLTVRAIAAKFGVAYGTAEKAVKQLVAEGIVRAVPGGGITVLGSGSGAALAGKEIAMLMPPRMAHAEDQAFLRGALSEAEPEGVRVRLVRPEGVVAASYSFGDYIAGLDADGVVAVSHPNSALGFYHALVRGVDLVSDIYYEHLPVLPVVQTDNFGHGRRAAEIFHRSGRDQVVVVSCSSPLGRAACQGYFAERYDGLLSYARETKMDVSPIVVTEPGAMDLLSSFLFHFSDRRGVFTLDIESNILVAMQFVRHQLPVEGNNFIAYDSLADTECYEGLAPIPTVGPSLERIGAALARKLIRKWQEGSFAEPLREKI
jgi:DNA-binding LacI/PurR family transcriptional regulator